MRPGLRIRIAGAADASALAALEAAAFGDASWGTDNVSASLVQPSVTTMIVYDESDVDCGFLIWRRSAGEAEILSLGVLPSHRRQGAAAALLARLMEDAAREGVREVFLEVDDGNEAARTLYERRGFVHVGARAGYYRSGADALVLRRAL